MHGEFAVSVGGEIVYQKNFSYSDAPYIVDKNSQYLIASITKQFTASALLRGLYDREIARGGEIDPKPLKKLVETDLHKPISFFLPSNNLIWKNSMPAWANTVTVHNLLTHTSGISFKNHLEFAETCDDMPGKKFSYSNAGYVLIGKIISELSKESLDTYFKRVLFDLADMKESFLPLSGTPKSLKTQDNFKKLALGFNYNLISPQVTFDLADEKVAFEELDVAGGIVSTARDLIKWNNALYGGKIIPKELVELMTSQYVSVPGDDDGRWYGYGIYIYSHGNKVCYSHKGGSPGYQSKLIYIPGSGITIVHLSNSQVNYESYKFEMEKIFKLNQCDAAKAEAIFDEQFPDYKLQLKTRMNIFDFSTALKNAYLKKLSNL